MPLTVEFVLHYDRAVLENLSMVGDPNVFRRSGAFSPMFDAISSTFHWSFGAPLKISNGQFCIPNNTYSNS
jgi:hypothetical protein